MIQVSCLNSVYQTAVYSMISLNKPAREKEPFLKQFLTCIARYTSIRQHLFCQCCRCQASSPKEHWTKAEDNWNRSKGECLKQEEKRKKIQTAGTMQNKICHILTSTLKKKQQTRCQQSYIIMCSHTFHYIERLSQSCKSAFYSPFL